MDTLHAWQALFSLSSGNQWVRIPEDIRKILGLDSRLGIQGGILCTQTAANGVNRFLDKLNSISAISK